MTVICDSPSEIARFLADFAYWAGRCFTIADKRGQEMRLRLNTAQRMVFEAEERLMRERGEVRLYVLKGRQGGVTTFEQARNLYQVCTERNFNVMTLAHTSDDTTRIFVTKTQFAVKNFPQGEDYPTFGGKLAREVGVPDLNTHFWTGTAGADRIGRSLTLKRLHFSEFALADNPMETLRSAGPAVVPHGSTIVLETTASGFDSAPHNFWREAQQGANGYATLFIPWWLCDVDNYRLPLMEPDELGILEPDEQLLAERHGLDHEQIKWRRREMAKYGRQGFLTEFAEDEDSCWAAAGGMFYDAELLKHLMARVKQPLSTEWGGALEVYGEPREGERAVGGCDTAEGFTVGEPSKKDRSAFTIRAFPSRRLLVKFEDRSVQPEHLAGFLNTWGRKYGGVYWVIEKNAHGITTLRHLRDHYRYPLPGIYHRRQQDAAHKEPSADLIGWHTNESSKALLLDYGRTLLTAARDGEADVPSLSALRDAFAVRRDAKGKVNLNGRDVLLSEMLCEVGHQSVPAQRSWWLGPVEKQTTKGAK